MSAAKPPELAGDLAEFPTPELFQFLSACRKSGILHFEDAEGEVALCEGQLARASAGHLRGVEAALALLGQRQGRFRFHAGPVADEERLELSPLLMEQARLEDEFERIAAFLPTKDMPLSLREPVAPIVDELQCGADDVLALLQQSPQCTLPQLERLSLLAPLKVRLSVAQFASIGRFLSRASIQRRWKPQATSEQWYVRLLFRYSGCVRLLFGLPSDWPLASVERAIRELARTLTATMPPLVLLPGGPSFLRLRPAAGGTVSLTLLPLGPQHRYLTQSFVNSVDAAVAVEGAQEDDFGMSLPGHVIQLKISRTERDDSCLTRVMQQLDTSEEKRA